jgi:hypothetical protein
MVRPSQLYWLLVLAISMGSSYFILEGDSFLVTLALQLPVITQD